MLKDKPTDDKKQLVKAIIGRLAQAYGVEKTALPQVLGCQKNVINNWGYYGRIPFDHLFHCHETTGVSMDWLLSGEQQPVKFNDKHLSALTDIAAKLVADGLDFNMISERYPGATEQLTRKFTKDLSDWLQQKSGPEEPPK